MKFIIFLLFFFTLFVSCGDEESSNSGRNYEIPRFAVYPLSDSGVPGGGSLSRNFLPPEPNSKLKYLVLAPVHIFFPLAYAQSQIDCTAEIDYYNDAPQTFGRAADIPPQELLHRFYAQAIFYDCIIRQQAQSFGIGESVQEDEEGEEVTILTAENIGNDPERRTEYVSWTDLPESENVRGRLVNKYIQDDGIVTKTRVDLSIEDGARRVTSLLHFVNSNDGAKFYSKASFRESNQDAEGNFQRHEVRGRLYDTTDNTIVQVRAVADADSGSSIELRRCPISSGDIDTDCSSAPPVVKHYNNDGAEVSDSSRSFGDDAADSFYEGQNEEQYFTPEFSIEE